MTVDMGARLLIRDAHEGDVASCLALDHSYETDRVWQMQVNEDALLDIGSAWEIMFRLERLPRRVDIVEPTHEGGLRQRAIDPDTLFLIAGERGTREPYAYLTLHHDRAHALGTILDWVVSKPYRRQHIATRLLNVARRWGKERGIARLNAECSTKNVPASLFLDKMGFRRCGFNDKYFHGGDIALLYSQPLR